jgi:hypothetical protein
MMGVCRVTCRAFSCTSPRKDFATDFVDLILIFTAYRFTNELLDSRVLHQHDQQPADLCALKLTSTATSAAATKSK